MCDVVEGVFLKGLDLEALEVGIEQAGRDAVDAVFLTDGPLGDAIVLAAGLAAGLAGRTKDLLVGVRVSLGPVPHRHPTILAREMTTLDHVTGGRAVVAFMGPFTDANSASIGEAIALCREMWTKGIGVSAGPRYPVPGAVNRPLPCRPGGPPVALDLTDGLALSGLDPALLRLCDVVLVPQAHDAALPEALREGVDVCWIRPE